jgi:hypothetical protein
MGVQADPDPPESDSTILAVQFQELRESYPATIRTIAARWADGLKALLGLSGIIGVVSAPIAARNLQGATKVVTGLLLVGVFLTATVGLWWTMSAAYGTASVDRPPDSLTSFEALRRRKADRARARLVWGRRSALAALFLLGAAVGVAWIDPWASESPRLQVTTTQKVSYCGQLLDAPEGTIAVRTNLEGQVEIPLNQVASVKIVDSCPR